jgi:hypothetical protein
MAVPTSSQFLSRFPEFGEQAAPVIAGALEEAGRFTPEKMKRSTTAVAASWCPACWTAALPTALRPRPR